VGGFIKKEMEQTNRELSLREQVLLSMSDETDRCEINPYYVPDLNNYSFKNPYPPSFYTNLDIIDPLTAGC
jgi:hypothetical protein